MMSREPMRPRNVGGCACGDCGNARSSTLRAAQKRAWRREASNEMKGLPTSLATMSFGDPS